MIKRIVANNFSYIILGLCLIIQSIFYFESEALDTKVNAVLFFLSSVVFGILIIVFFRDSREQYYLIIERKSKKKQKLIISLVAVGIIIFGLIRCYQGIIHKPIDPKNSDIIPTIQELCFRLKEGNFVYEPIEKFGYHLPVTYLPMQWVPYYLAEYFHFDYRWIAIGIWVIAFFIIVKRSFKYNNVWGHLYSVLFSLFPFLILSNPSGGHFTGILLDTVEFMVVGYYMLFILSLNIDNPISRGIIVGICLMSRYSLVLWLPVVVWVLWQSEPKKKMLISIFTTLIFIVIIYVIPFLSKDWMAFYKGYKYYDQAALGEWNNLISGSQKPYQLYRGFGFASFIYEYTPQLDNLSKIKLLQKIHFLASISVTAFSILLFFRLKNKIHYKVFLMASFKIYIAVFLFFIQVPYQYLMLVDLYATITIFVFLMNYRKIISPSVT